jgi:hypothetical protein
VSLLLACVSRDRAVCLAALVGVLSSGGLGCEEPSPGNAPDAPASWPRVEAMAVRVHDLPAVQERGPNPRSLGRRQPAMTFRQYLYDWRGLRVGVEAGVPVPARGVWQDAWIARADLDPRDFDGDFAALSEAQAEARAALDRLVAPLEDGRPACSGLSGMSDDRERAACIRLLVCAVGYYRVPVRVDPEAPGRVAPVDEAPPARPRPRAFAPWTWVGFDSRDALCESRALGKSDAPG